MSNPLLTNTYIVDFEKVTADHVKPAVDFLVEQTEKTLTEIESVSEPSWHSIMEPLNRLDVLFQRSFSPVAHLLSVRNSDDLRKAYEEVQPRVVELSLKIQQNTAIYEALVAIRDGNAWIELNPAQKRIVHNKIKDAELSGIALEGEKRRRFNELSRELSKLGTDFSNNVLDSVKKWELIITDQNQLTGVPDSFLESAAHSYVEKHGGSGDAHTGPWRLTLDYPMIEPILRDCDNRQLRQQLYLANIAKATEKDHDNTPLINQILILRKEKAKLLGFENYGEVSTYDKMAGSVAAVNKLLDELLSASKEPGAQEIAELHEFAERIGHPGKIENWDFRYLSEKLRKEKYDFSEEEVRGYFPLDKVLEGMFALVKKIFGVSVSEHTGEAPAWHEDVRFYKLYDESKTHIASFLFDPYSRPSNKRGGAWMNECVTRQIIDGKDTVPVAYVVCNFSKPTKDKPSLLTFRDVETTFHEFGHALQHMLTEVTEPEASGINGVEWDAVELPSQFMENWCYHKPTIKSLSAHYISGEPLPDALFNKLKEAKNFNAANGMLRQLVFAKIDMTLHTSFNPQTDDLFTTYQKVAGDIAPLPPHPDDKFLCSFSHIFAGGYAAGYYSYKWAEVLSADAFSAFEEVGLENEEKIKDVGQKFRSTVLALGGSEHPMSVFKKFRGREPSTKPLLQHSGLI